MVRRFFVPVSVAALILPALILAAPPSPSFGLGSRAVSPRYDDHYRCMYHCEEGGGSFRPEPRRWSWGSWPPPRPRPRPPARPTRHRPSCWLFCGGDRWGSGWGQPNWSGPSWWCGPGPYYRDGWYGHRRPCRPGGYGWPDHDRYDWSYRDRDRDGSGGYDAHRHHPRGADF